MKIYHHRKFNRYKYENKRMITVLYRAISVSTGGLINV